MRFVWKLIHRDLSGPSEHEKLAMQAAQEAKEAAQETAKHREHLKSYFDTSEKLSANEKTRFGDKLVEWYQNGDKVSMRMAGVDAKANEKDYQKRHALLSSAYVSWNANAENISGSVDFKGNDTAEHKVGLGDMLPPNVKAVLVRKKGGSEVECVRARNPRTGRIGYYESDALAKGEYLYVPIHTGDQFEVMRTIDPKDPKAQRDFLREHLAVYKQGAMEGDEGEELYYDNYGLAVEATPAARREKGRAQTGRAREGYRKALESQGVRPAPRKTEGRGPKKPSQAPKRAPRVAANISTGVERVETKGLRKKIVDLSKQYSGTDRFASDFQGIDMLRGGKLGCAWVATTILKEAGVLDAVYPGTYTAEHHLKQKGWTVAPRSQAEAGDVVIWEKLPGRTVTGPNGPQYMPGHRHIGIVTGPNEAVSNSSAQLRPVTHAIDSGRGVEMILKPPRAEVERPDRRVASYETGPVTPGQPVHHLTRDLLTIAGDHRANSSNLEIEPGRKKLLDAFLNTFHANKARYERVGRAADMPPELIAAIHNREGGMRFDTYLHNGQKLGKPTTIVPKGVFFREDQWEEAAIHALKTAKGVKDRLGIHFDTKDMGKLLAFAEAYNGLGYRKRENTPSPYVYAGTNMDTKQGRYVADGKFSTSSVDRGVGVAAMLQGVHEQEGSIPTKPGEAAA